MRKKFYVQFLAAGEQVEWLDVLESGARRTKGRARGREKKEVMSVCCMTEVVLPAILKQETRCVLDRKVNICGVLVFRRDKN